MILAAQFRDPQRLLVLARRAEAANKPIVLLRPGGSQAARASAATHTGAMAGDYAMMRVRVEDAGVCVLESLAEAPDKNEPEHNEVVTNSEICARAFSFTRFRT